MIGNQNKKKILSNNGSCIDKCENDNIYKYEYNGKCYENCSNGYLTDDNNNPTNKCKCELEKCESCPTVALNKDLCTKCNKDFYSIENDPSNIGEYINCYKAFKGYYIDKDEQMFKKCYFTCEECEIKGNYTFHNCLECNGNFTFNISFNNYTNCYQKCPYYYYFDNDNNYHCTINDSCPNDYPYLSKDKFECSKN